MPQVGAAVGTMAQTGPAGRERPEHFRLSIWDVGSGPQGSWVPQVGVAGRCHGPAGSGRLARRRGQTAGAPGG